MTNEQLLDHKEAKYEKHQSVRRSFIDEALSFLLGVVTCIFIYYLGFATCQNIVGWINKPVVQNIVTPVAGVSAELR